MTFDYLDSILLEWLIDDDDIVFYSASVAGLSPMAGLLSLVALYVMIAIDLYGSGLELIGLLYLLVYVGGVAMLFAFVLRLLDLSHNDDDTGDDSSFVLGILLDSMPFNQVQETISVFTSSTLISETEANYLGKLEFTEYGVLIIIIAIALLLTIVGTINVIKVPADRKL